MSSQGFEIKTTKTSLIPITELSVGDVVYGVNQTTWVHRYRVYELREPHKHSNNRSLAFVVGRIGFGYENERVPWTVSKYSEAMVEDRTYKYDPSQAGDTDDDV